MPPKKSKQSNHNGTTAVSEPSAAASSSSSKYDSLTRPLLMDLGRLLTLHQQERPNPTAGGSEPSPDVYAATVQRLIRQVKELEKPLQQLTIVQRDEKRRRKAERATQAPAPTTLAASSSSSTTTNTNSHMTVAPLPAPTSPFSPSHSHAPSQSQLNALSDWLRSEAPECLIQEKWEFAPAAVDSQEGTGVRAIKALKKDELFLSIPRSIMMTSDGLAETSPIGRILSYDPLCEKIPSLLLACCLMYERSLGTESKWYHYIQCLPRHVNLPMLWSVDHIVRDLQASPTVFDVLALKQNLIRQYAHLNATLKSHQTKLSPNFDFTWHGFQWAVSIIMSRQNRIPSLARPDAESAIALIPGWDSCNHRGSGYVATFYLSETHESQSHVMEDVEPGQTIYLYYGNRTNAQLMTYAGFVDHKHLNDAMEVIFTLDGSAASLPSKSTEEDPFAKIKMMLLKKAGMGATFGTKLPLNTGESMSSSASSSTAADAEELSQLQQSRQQARLHWNAIMHFARVCCLHDKDHISLALKHKSSFGNPLSPSFHFLPSLYPEHDLQAYTFLHDALTSMVHAYSTTIEEDEAELVHDETRREEEEHQPETDRSSTSSSSASGSHLHAHRRLAIEMRRAEKKLLMRACEQTLGWKEKEHKKLNP